MNNKICNPKQEVPSSKDLNDKDYLTAILNLENDDKELCSFFN